MRRVPRFARVGSGAVVREVGDGGVPVAVPFFPARTVRARGKVPERVAFFRGAEEANAVNVCHHGTR
ncbi:hypothetical protein FHX37_1266 [Haloactinospora alba]|uniref:Uncharacterized protein n=1 Tax=Haloactinospora alba TaxID=405555 RepID=A0A543NHP7_9ACTN|nr:hypothetical protein FHX37_1266 [Haloactinospora alba]